MKLRPYQEDAIAAVEEGFSEYDKQILIAPTGSGKTILFSNLANNLQPGKTLILAHREELLSQAIDKLHLATGLHAGLERATTNASLSDPVVVSSVQTMVRRLHKWKPDHFNMIVADECFPSGTMVGNKPIEAINPGDIVPSWDEKFGFVYQMVIRTMTKKPSSLMLATLVSGEKIIATPEHPFLTSNGWKPLRECLNQTIIKHELHPLRQRILANTKQTNHLLQSVPIQTHCIKDDWQNNRNKSQTDRSNLLPLRSIGHHWTNQQVSQDAMEYKKSGLLQQGMRGCEEEKNRFHGPGQHQSVVRKRAHEEEKPNEKQTHQEQNESNPQGNRSSTKTQGRQRKAHTNSTENASQHSRMADRSYCPNWRGSGITISLQNRYSPPGDDDRHRGGRPKPFCSLQKSARPEEEHVPDLTRVVSIQILKPGSDGEYGGLCPGGLVHNLEVSGTHTYLVGSGLIAHNCHRSLSLQWQKVLSHFHHHADVLGCTATPTRGDKKNLLRYYQNIAYEIKLRTLIEQGFLAPISVETVPLQIDLTQVNRNTLDGDFNDEELASAIDPYLEQIADHIATHHPKRKILAFLPLIKTSQKFALICQERGLMAHHIDGLSPDRTEALVQFKNGEFTILCNSMLLTEGYDEPSIDCMLILRPTMLPGFYCLDTQTEILSKHRGWVTDAKPGELVAAFNPKTGITQWEPVIASARRPLQPDEHFVSIQSQSTDIRVTNKHRMLVDNKRRLGWKFKEAEQVADYKDGTHIPVSGKNPQPDAPISDHDVRFIAWAMTDASYNKITRAITIYQQSHQPWIEEIEECLVGCGFKHTRKEISPKSNFKRSSPLHIWTISFGKPRLTDKHLTGWGRLEEWISKDFSMKLMDLSERQFDILMETIHLADGNKQNGQSWTRRSYHISKGNKTFIERLQAACLFNGYRANVSRFDYNQNPFWILHAKKQQFSRVGSVYDSRPQWIKESHTAEDCWCVQVPSGAILTRRNGKASITGNCQMLGRGTRIHPGKENLLILDFLWIANAHLARPSCLLTDDEEVQKRMLDNEDGDLLDSEDQAKSDLEDALKRKLEEANKRRQLAGKTPPKKHASIEEFALLFHKEELTRYSPLPNWESSPPPPKQLQFLARSGFDPAAITSKGLASILIGTLMPRISKKLCTYKQLRHLVKYGAPNPLQMSVAQANEFLTARWGRGSFRPRPHSILPNQDVDYELPP